MRVIAIVTAVILASLSSTVLPAQAADPAQALRKRIEVFQTAWNSHDGGGVAAVFTDDADQVMADGPTTSGLPALQRWWRDRFTSMEPGRRIALTVSSLRLVNPDVAVINTIAVSSGRDAQGHELSSQKDRGTWVVVQKGGQWFIAALRVYPAERVPPR